MKLEFWHTVAESAIRGIVAAVLVALVAFIRLVLKTRKEYNLFNTMSQQQAKNASKHTSGEQCVWYGPALRFEAGRNTTWAYEPIAREQMNWWRWFRKVLWYSLLYKRSTTEPKGLSGQENRV